MSQEPYEFEIGEDGIDYDILDTAFNQTTKSFIAKNVNQPGMKILDVGCGSGKITAWLATVLCPTGTVTSIDNSAEQLKYAKRRIESQGINNVNFRLLSAYNINDLKEKFDMMYCRFVLHHLHSPRMAIQRYFDVLNDNGIYIAEEGIISSAFSYPCTYAWQQHRPDPKIVNLEKDDQGRDGDFGMKLFYNMKKIGFKITDIKLVQPLFSTQKEKTALLKNREIFKQTALKQGVTEQEWNDETKALQLFADDEFSIAGFYQSCQVAGKKI